MNRVDGALAGLVLAGAIAALAVPEVLSQPLLRGEAAVLDGDSIVVAGTHVRIQGIDAPELRQMCGEVRCGLAAKEALQRAIGGATVTCKPSGLDRYGRTLAQCATAAVRDLGAHMVGAGYARSFVRYGDRYRDAEDAAKAERLGLWRTDFGNPEDWRRQSR